MKIKIISNWIYGKQMQGETMEADADLIAYLDLWKIKYEVINERKTKTLPVSEKKSDSD